MHRRPLNRLHGNRQGKEHTHTHTQQSDNNTFNTDKLHEKKKRNQMKGNGRKGGEMKRKKYKQNAETLADGN